MTTMLKWVVTACLVGMLTSCEDKGNNGPDSGSPGGDGGGGGENPGTVQPGVLKGRVVDSQGKPIEGSIIYTGSALNNGVPGMTRTDAQGNYQMSKLVQNIAYKVYAWVDVTYHDKKYCLRVSPETSTDYETIGIREGAIRNFRWRLQGRMEDSTLTAEEDGSWYGGTIRLFYAFEDNDYKSPIELKLTPNGPLIDGSTGSVLTKTVDPQKTQFVLDIPAGVYKLSATRVKSDGTRVPARLGPDSSTGSAEYDFEFKPAPTTLECGSYAGTITGLDRGFVYVHSQ
ncbi:carboxypeptidase-like regulatory domain-containing protein [Hyalangium versicolor]|uniref:carboxypeptidase-like regulatory domain-containing protein n=1 Tax=Hyalangium versicolor TaxID=2861190 RepID=UPI001CCF3822|nr:carboxypeptidase-like regulatory domain-containing protein [Hyalangium versicolor]